MVWCGAVRCVEWPGVAWCCMVWSGVVCLAELGSGMLICDVM